MKAAKLLLNVYAFLLIEQDKRRPGGGGACSIYFYFLLTIYFLNQLSLKFYFCQRVRLTFTYSICIIIINKSFEMKFCFPLMLHNDKVTKLRTRLN